MFFTLFIQIQNLIELHEGEGELLYRNYLLLNNV